MGGRCVVDSCSRLAFCKGYCSSHYHRLKRYGDPLKGGTYRLPKEQYKQCSIAGCKNDGSHRGLCNKHYCRLIRNGNPKAIKKMPNGTHATQHPLYNSWRAMFDRCQTPTNAYYKDYGGRGIKVCERWQPPEGFWNFVKDMGPKPSYETSKSGRAIYSLDRIDVNGDYCPENCRWATQSQQVNNQRRSKKYTVKGFTGGITECARYFAVVTPHQADNRVRNGWSIEDAVLVPVGGRRTV